MYRGQRQRYICLFEIITLAWLGTDVRIPQNMNWITINNINNFGRLHAKHRHAHAMIENEKNIIMNTHDETRAACGATVTERRRWKKSHPNWQRTTHHTLILTRWFFTFIFYFFCFLSLQIYTKCTKHGFFRMEFWQYLAKTTSKSDCKITIHAYSCLKRLRVRILSRKYARVHNKYCISSLLFSFFFRVSSLNFRISPTACMLKK